MNILPPPLSTFQPPTTTTTTTTTTTLTTNGGVNASPSNHHHHHSSSTSSPPTSSAIIIMIVISSVIILSATVYLLLRYLSRRCNHFRTTSSPTDDVVSTNQTNHVPHHVLPVTANTTPNSLPLFTFASLTGKITGGDCAVCLSKFAGADLLRLLPLCCHAFHVDCIDVWLRSNHTCPLCRSTVNPTDEDILNTLSSDGNRNNSFRIEIGSFRRNPSSMSDRRSYSVGSYDYVLDDGYEIPVESTHRSGVVSDCGSVDKDSAAPAESAVAEVAAGGGSGRRNWLRDYVDRFSTSLSSHSRSLRGSGRFFAGNSRRSDGVNEFEGSHGRIGEEISELFRWFSGV